MPHFTHFHQFPGPNGAALVAATVIPAVAEKQDGLANGAAGEADAEEEEEQRARTLREMKACAERLRKPRTAATARVLAILHL